MKNVQNPILFQDDDSVTYIEGLGFVPSRGGKPLSSQIRAMSNLICFLLLSYFLFQRLLTIPMLYLAAFVGFDIKINRFTGLVTSTQYSRLAVSLLASIVSTLLVFLLLAYVYRHAIARAGIFQKSRRGINAIALPILMAVGLLSVALGGLFENFSGLLGLIFDSLPSPVSSATLSTFLSLGGTMVLALLQELLFRGVLLTPLRRFGDGFAIFASTLLFALWANGPISAVSSFLYGLCAAYFVIRSGSVRTALYGRFLLEMLLFGFRCAEGMLEQKTAQLLLFGAAALLILLSLIAYIRFINRDKNAFRLAPAQGGMRTYTRIGFFCSSFAFLLFFISMVVKIAGTVQIIGW